MNRPIGILLTGPVAFWTGSAEFELLSVLDKGNEICDRMCRTWRKWNGNGDVRSQIWTGEVGPITVNIFTNWIVNRRFKGPNFEHCSVCDLYQRSNSILYDFSSCNSVSLDSLHNTFCMQMYGCELWNLSNDQDEQFKIAWRKVKRRI